MILGGSGIGLESPVWSGPISGLDRFVHTPNDDQHERIRSSNAVNMVRSKCSSPKYFKVIDLCRNYI